MKRDQLFLAMLVCMLVVHGNVFSAPVESISEQFKKYVYAASEAGSKAALKTAETLKILALSAKDFGLFSGKLIFHYSITEGVHTLGLEGAKKLLTCETTNFSDITYPHLALAPGKKQEVFETFINRITEKFLTDHSIDVHEFFDTLSQRDHDEELYVNRIIKELDARGESLSKEYIFFLGSAYERDFDDFRRANLRGEISLPKTLALWLVSRGISITVSQKLFEKLFTTSEESHDFKRLVATIITQDSALALRQLTVGKLKHEAILLTESVLLLALGISERYSNNPKTVQALTYLAIIPAFGQAASSLFTLVGAAKKRFIDPVAVDAA